MDLDTITLGDMERLWRAIEAAKSDNPDVVRRVLERVTPNSDLRHSRITIGTIIRLLDQTGGSTVLPDEVVTFLRRLNDTADAVVPLADGTLPQLLFDADIKAEIVPLGSVLVSYVKSITELIQLTKIGWAHNKITAENFAADFMPQPENIGRATERVVAFSLIRFSRPVTGDEALQGMGERSFRPASLRETIVLLGQQTDLARKYSIAVMGSNFFDRDNGLRRPFVNNFGPNDCVQLSLAKRGETTLKWDKHSYFLAARNY